MHGGVERSRIGVTGHQRIADEAAWPWIRRQVRDFLEFAEQPVAGFSSLAIGADQVFAEEIVALGGSLHVVVPFEDYRRSFVSEQHRANYDQLLARATSTLILPSVGNDEECYLSAGRKIVDSVERLVAVWDGLPAKGLGGTGDVVAYARRVSRPTRVIDPVARSVREL